MKFIVTKYLALEFKCEADSQEEAEEACAEACDLEFQVIDCQYEVKAAA